MQVLGTKFSARITLNTDTHPIVLFKKLVEKLLSDLEVYGLELETVYDNTPVLALWVSHGNDKSAWNEKVTVLLDHKLSVGPLGGTYTVIVEVTAEYEETLTKIMKGILPEAFKHAH